MTGLYFHIPFCKRKCPYCAFNSICDMAKEDEYFQAMLDEIESFKRQEIAADTIYLGGGTPSIAKFENVEKLMLKIREVFEIKKLKEATIEINPTTAIEDNLRKYVALGFNRVSVGIQSFSDLELQKLKRTHTKNIAKKAVKIAHDVGFNNISIDLMIGIPEQTKTSIMATLKELENLKITHVSIYMLKIEKDTEFYFNKPKNLPVDDVVAEFYLLICNELKKMGFIQYEISNFAKKGYESKHNLKYWGLEEYLGFGVGAHSFYGKKRFHNENKIFEYVKNPAIDFMDSVDLEFEWFILGLRLRKGLELQKLKQLKIYDENFEQKLQKLEFEKLIYIENDRLKLTLKGMLMQNLIITYLTT